MKRYTLAHTSQADNACAQRHLNLVVVVDCLVLVYYLFHFFSL